MEVAWLVEPVAGQTKGSMTGSSVVGPDGTLEMGPYGVHRVAGLTVAQAATAIDKELHHCLKNPRLRLRVVPPETTVAQAAAWQAGPGRPSPEAGTPVAAGPWRPAQHSGVMLVSGPENPSDLGPMLTQTDEIPGKKQEKAKGEGKEKDAAPDGQERLPLPAEKTGPGGTERLPLPGEKKAGTDSGGPPGAVPAVPPPALPLEHAGPPCGHPGHPFGPPPLPRECARVTLPPYRTGPPDVLLIEATVTLATHPVSGPHLVRPDGTVSVGVYGPVYVAGMTMEEARAAVSRAIYARLNQEKKKFTDVFDNTSVDVMAYNSKVYYVISDLAGLGDQITRLPITGSETVLDAVSLNLNRGGYNGLAPVASKHHIWVARPCCGGRQQILQVDWLAITRNADPTTNFQLLPGDRVYVKADTMRTINTWVDKIVSPAERLLGVTLLGSETVNSIRLRTTSGGAVP
jgi:polysaccharide export outer membrane protein